MKDKETKYREAVERSIKLNDRIISKGYKVDITRRKLGIRDGDDSFDAQITMLNKKLGKLLMKESGEGDIHQWDLYTREIFF